MRFAGEAAPGGAGGLGEGAGPEAMEGGWGQKDGAGVVGGV